MSLAGQIRTELPQGSLVREVAPAAAWVVQNADHVKINVGKIAGYQRMIFSKYSLITHLDSEHHFFSQDREVMAAYVLARFEFRGRAFISRVTLRSLF